MPKRLLSLYNKIKHELLPKIRRVDGVWETGGEEEDDEEAIESAFILPEEIKLSSS